MDKKFIFLGAIIGSIIGKFLPDLFGVGDFSMISFISTAIGGFLGIWITFKILN